MQEAPMSSSKGLERLLSEQGRSRSVALRRRIRRRALADAAVIVVLSGVFCARATTEVDLLLIAMACVSIGILLYLVRRGADLETLARADRWRDEAVRGRGVSLGDWHRGARLPTWEERRRELA